MCLFLGICCLPRNQSLGPKRLGTIALQDKDFQTPPHPAVSYLSTSDCICFLSHIVLQLYQVLGIQFSFKSAIMWLQSMFHCMPSVHCKFLFIQSSSFVLKFLSVFLHFCLYCLMMLILNLFDSSGIRGSVEPPFLLHRVSLQCLPWWCSSLESFSPCLLPASDSLTLLSLVGSTVDYILFFFSWYIYSLTWLYPKKECVGSKLPFTLEMYCLVNSCIALDSQLSLSYFLGILLQSLMHFGSVPLQTEVFPSPFWNLFRSFLIFLGVLNFAMAGLRVCVFVCMYVSC